MLEVRDSNPGGEAFFGSDGSDDLSGEFCGSKNKSVTVWCSRVRVEDQNKENILTYLQIPDLRA